MSDHDRKHLGKPVPLGRRSTRREEETQLDAMQELHAERLALEQRNEQIEARMREVQIEMAFPSLRARDDEEEAHDE